MGGGSRVIIILFKLWKIMFFNQKLHFNGLIFQISWARIVLNLGYSIILAPLWKRSSLSLLYCCWICLAMNLTQKCENYTYTNRWNSIIMFGFFQPPIISTISFIIWEVWAGLTVCWLSQFRQFWYRYSVFCTTTRKRQKAILQWWSWPW